MTTAKMTVEDLQKHLGAVIKFDKKILISKLFTQPETYKEFSRTFPGIQDGQFYSRPMAEIGKVLQKFHKAVFVHQGDITFTPAKWEQARFKINVELTPNDIVGTWMGYMYQEGKMPSMQEIVRFAINKLIFEKVKEEKELLCVYNGVKKAHVDTEDGPIPAEDTYNGIRHILQYGDDTGENKANYISGVGELSIIAKTVYTQINDAILSMPERYRYLPKTLYLSYAKRDLYRKGWEETVGSRIRTRDSHSDSIDDNNTKLKPIASMFGKSDFWITLPNNLTRIVDQIREVGNFSTFPTEYGVKIIADFHERPVIDCLEWVWHNIATGSVSASQSTT